MTWPVESGCEGSKSTPIRPPPKGSSGPRLSNRNEVPAAALKSTIMSARSAKARRTVAPLPELPG